MNNKQKTLDAIFDTAISEFLDENLSSAAKITKYADGSGYELERGDAEKILEVARKFRNHEYAPAGHGIAWDRALQALSDE